MDAILGAMSDVFGFVGTVITEMTSNPITLFLLACSLVPLGISIFKRLKRAAKA